LGKSTILGCLETQFGLNGSTPEEGSEINLIMHGALNFRITSALLSASHQSTLLSRRHIQVVARRFKDLPTTLLPKNFHLALFNPERH